MARFNLPLPTVAIDRSAFSTVVAGAEVRLESLAEFSACSIAEPFVFGWVVEKAGLDGVPLPDHVR